MSRSSQHPRPTLQMLRVLRVMLDHPRAAHYGLELSRQSGLATGTIYPILTRLEQAGWVQSSWEEAEPSQAGRPRRRLYRFTEDGAELARTALEEGWQGIVPAGAPRPGLRAPRPREAPA